VGPSGSQELSHQARANLKQSRQARAALGQRNNAPRSAAVASMQTPRRAGQARRHHPLGRSQPSMLRNTMHRSGTRKRVTRGSSGKLARRLSPQHPPPPPPPHEIAKRAARGSCACAIIAKENGGVDTGMDGRLCDNRLSGPAGLRQQAVRARRPTTAGCAMCQPGRNAGAAGAPTRRGHGRKQKQAELLGFSTDRRVVLELPARELGEDIVALGLALCAPLVPHRRADVARV
jgi:hypothetical protein